MDYCSVGDLYAYGLPRGAAPNPARLIASVNTAADAFVLDGHGFATDDEVQFRAEGSGTLPAPIVAGTPYYAIPFSEHSFGVAAARGGALLDITSAGARIMVVGPSPNAAAITWASRILDDNMPANAVPRTEGEIHPLLRMTCAELAAGKVLTESGAMARSLSDMVDAAMKRVARWAKGVPLRGPGGSPPTNVAASATAPFRDRRGWTRFGGL